MTRATERQVAFEFLAAFGAASLAGAAGFALGRRAARRAQGGARLESGPLLAAAHEMRTPLTGVVGAVDLLLDTGLTPEQRTYAGAIRGSAGAMLRLVDEMLDLSERESAPRAALAETIDVAALVEDVAELLAPRAQAKGLDFAAIVAEDAPAEIVGDAGRIRQILLNLAGNAIKFTETGGVGLRVELAREGLAFRVVDTGQGFDPGEAERLFREYERSPRAEAGGAGLGLAISRELARAMGGALSAHSEPRVGSTFTLFLPCWGADAGRLEGGLEGRRVAVVSDAAFSGPWLVEWLGARGAVAWLVSSKDARQDPAAALAHCRPDVVIVDFGAADASAIARSARECGATKALLLLSPVERKALASLAEDGFDGYLVKPLRAASVLNVVAGATRGAAAPSTAMAFPNAGGLKILVAEDDPVSALIALAHLSRLGHASVHVADGAAAVEHFEREPFDAVLLDMRMPRLDGRAAAGRMRVVETVDHRRAALIVALTAEGAVADAGALKAAGLDHVLTKPLDRRALEALLAPLAVRAARSA